MATNHRHETLRMGTNISQSAMFDTLACEEPPTSAEKSSIVDPNNDPYLITFAEPYDALNPKDWPLRRKWAVTLVLSVSGLNRIMVSTIMAPALGTIALELNMTHTEAVMSMSAYLLASVFGPMVIGPFSEIYGRRWVLHVTSIWFLIWNIACGFANTKGLLISARLLAGFGASAIYALAGGVLGDVWRPEERGKSMGLYQLVPLLGGALGPILGGIITQYSTWRWMFWASSIVQATMIVLSLRLFHETHAPTILHERAKRLRQETGDQRYATVFERLDEGRSAAWVMQRSLSRPLRMLLFHRIIQIQACISGFQYGILYIMLSTFADLWTSRYNDSIIVSGLHYVSLCLGEIAGSQVGGYVMDAVYRRQKAHAGGRATPEFRIPLILPGAILLPIGLILYGWAGEKQLYWLVVDLGAFIAAFAGQTSGQALQAYVIDSYPDHTSSAAAATQLFRSLAAFGFPLFAPTMYEKLGYGRGNTLLAALAIGIGIPAPLLLWRYGSRLRAKGESSY